MKHDSKCAVSLITSLVFIVVVLVAGCRSNEKAAVEVITKLIDTKVAVVWGTSNDTLWSCSATVVDHHLKLYIEQQPDSLSSYAIEILKSDTGVNVAVSQPWSVLDSSYVAPRFKILNPQLRFNKTSYEPKDIVQGDLKLLVLGHRSYFRNDGEMALRENGKLGYSTLYRRI